MNPDVQASEEELLTCNGCHKQIERLFTDIDHVIARQFNGPDNAENKQVLCLNCHRVKSLYERIFLKPIKYELEKYFHSVIANQQACEFALSAADLAAQTIGSLLKNIKIKEAHQCILAYKKSKKDKQKPAVTPTIKSPAFTSLKVTIENEDETLDWQSFFDNHVRADKHDFTYMFDAHKLAEYFFNKRISMRRLKHEFISRGFSYCCQKRTIRNGRKTKGSFLGCWTDRIDKKRKAIVLKTCSFL